MNKATYVYMFEHPFKTKVWHRWMAEYIFGEFYTFTGKSYRRGPDPMRRECIIKFQVISKVKPHYTECLEFWMDNVLEEASQ